MQRLLTCRCGEVIVKSVNEKTKIHNKVIVFSSGKAFAVCKSCGAENEVPMQLDKRELKEEHRRPCLFLRKG